nr:hypothetical protein HK105_003334 [Polyrhizophydium stewartii]
MADARPPLGPITFALLPADDVAEAYRLESLGYPADEAASHEQLVFRQASAPHLFIGAYASVGDVPRRLVGFIVATATAGDRLTAASMKAHDPVGTTICIHSVCVAPDLRRRGIALAMLRHYVRYLRGLARGESPAQALAAAAATESASEPHRDSTASDKPVTAPRVATLAAKQHLVTLYEQAGFSVLGESALVHGADKWIELSLVL